MDVSYQKASAQPVPPMDVPQSGAVIVVAVVLLVAM